jgi:uncharacterized protein YtpQ (UPF0354 family)
VVGGEALSENTREIEDVLNLLRRRDVGRDAISLLVVKLMELRFPDVKAEFVSETDIKLTDARGSSSSFYLNNLWVECAQSPEETAEIADRYIRACLIDTNTQEQEAIEAGRVVALVKDSEYCKYIPEADRAAVTRHLTGDLWILLALDLPDSTVSLTAEKVEQIRLNSEDLYRAGIDNIAEMLTDMSFESFGECFTISCANLHYGASVLLLDYVWPQAEELVDGDVVAAVPARDTVLFTGSNNAQGVKELRDQANHIVSNGHHVISETLLRRVGDEWKPFS